MHFSVVEKLQTENSMSIVSRSFVKEISDEGDTILYTDLWLTTFEMNQRQILIPGAHKLEELAGGKYFRKNKVKRLEWNVRPSPLSACQSRTSLSLHAAGAGVWAAWI